MTSTGPRGSRGDAIGGGIEVRGGVAGTAARLEDLARAGAVLRRLGEQVGEQARVVLAVLADPGFLASAPRALRTFLVAQAALREAAAGPHGLLPAAARLDALGCAVRAAAAGYRAAEGMAEIASRGVPWTVGYTLGRLGGAGVGATGLALLPALAVASGASGASAPGDPAPGCASRPLLRGGPGRAAAGVLGRHAAAVEVAAAAAPGALTGLLASLGLVPSGGPVADVPGLARTLSTAGALSPWLRESALVRVSTAGPGVDARAPAGLADLAARIATLAPDGAGRVCAPGASAGRARLRVERIEAAGGRRAWVVEIPGIRTWSPRAGSQPLDLTGAVHAMAGRPTAASEAVRGALRAAGARPGEPVLLAGHSEGGMAAALAAADPATRREFDITHVVTFGAPISGSDLPRGVQVLAVEHTDDVVPRLDGAADPDRPTWVTVSRDAGADPMPRGSRDPLAAAHSLAGYARTAAAVDVSTNPSVRAWRDGAAAFFPGPGARVHSVEVLAERARP